ncbi:MAG: SufD family Fe-S cluster assembly protein [Bacilli bacterium]|nr:SufD family Fe-S cluster assembly protein [Bacilli bacterium]
MKYILNETPIRTTNSFRMNNITLDLELPTSTSFKSFNGYEGIRYEYDKEIKSPLGFTTKGTYAYIDINKSKDITLECNSGIICNTIINVDKNIDTTITIKYTGDNYNIQNIIVNASENSNITMNYINMSNAISLISFENKVEANSTVTHNLYDLSGNIRVYKYNSDNAGDNSSSYLNNIYLADNQEMLDMNYYISHRGKSSNSNINVVGLLDGEAKKSFKGTIDFIEGCSKSVGKEKEESICLSDKAVSSSMPVLLCHEEDVEGAHGVANGKIDEDTLFYIESRGLNKEESINLILQSKFNKYIELIKDESIKEEIWNYINKRGQ